MRASLSLETMQTIKNLIPYSYRLAEAKNEKGIPLLEQLLVDRVKKVQRNDLDFIINDLGNYQSGDSVSIALAIDWENVATEQIGGLYKLVLRHTRSSANL